MNRDKFVAGVTVRGGLVWSYFAMNERDFMAIWTKFYTPNNLDIFGRGDFNTYGQALDYALDTYRIEAGKRGSHEVPMPNLGGLDP